MLRLIRDWLENPFKKIKVRSSKSKCQMNVKFQKLKNTFDI